MIFHQPHNSLLENNYNAYIYTNEIWDPHFHKSFELIYVLKGSVRCTVNALSDTLTTGQFGLCLPYEIHSYIPESDSAYWVCVFSEDYVHTFAKQTLNKTGNSFKFTCSNIVTELLSAMLIDTPAPSVYAKKSCLYAVCGEYLSSVTLSDRSGSAGSIAAITDFVSEKHTENISLSDIGKLLGYDYHYVSRFFHKTFNMSFTTFLNLYRLETAVRLLTTTDKKVTAVAMESGFQSVRSFYDCFSKRFGISPMEYKRSVK